jgi:hypothetical protein
MCQRLPTYTEVSILVKIWTTNYIHKLSPWDMNLRVIWDIMTLRKSWLTLSESVHLVSTHLRCVGYILEAAQYLSPSAFKELVDAILIAMLSHVAYKYGCLLENDNELSPSSQALRGYLPSFGPRLHNVEWWISTIWSTTRDVTCQMVRYATPMNQPWRWAAEMHLLVSNMLQEDIYL